MTWARLWFLSWALVTDLEVGFPERHAKSGCVSSALAYILHFTRAPFLAYLKVITKEVNEYGKEK